MVLTRTERTIISSVAASTMLRQPEIEGRNPVVYLHGAGDVVPNELLTWPTRRIIRSLVLLGYPAATVVCTELWNNSTHQDRTLAAAQYLRDNNGAEGLPILVGSSHGALGALGTAVDQGAVCVVGIIPAIDVTFLRDNNVLGKQANINAAHGVVGTDPLPVGVDPFLRADDFSEIPVQLWYANNDAISTNIEAFASISGAEIHDVGALGHTEASMNAVDVTSMVDFIQAALTV